MLQFNHFNFNVLDLDRSLAFYKQALGLTPVREKAAEDQSFKLSGRCRKQPLSAGADLAAGSERAL